jgi:hypothetical protein
MEDFRAPINMLTGPLPPEWSTLTKLGRFLVNDCQITGTLPPTWSTLARLREFNAFNNLINGTLPL